LLRRRRTGLLRCGGAVTPTSMVNPGKRTAIVTGGAKRIGAAMVRALAADGWHVVIHCKSSVEVATALQRELAAAGGSASVLVADLAEPTLDHVIAAAQVNAPPLGLLVNSASRFNYDSFDAFDAAGWDAHQAVNVRAPALLTKAFAAAIVPGETGLVVNLLDAKLASLNPDFFTYTVSKIGLQGLTELAARAFAPRLRVNAIAPAVTMVSGPQSRENFAAAHVFNPLGRGVEVAEIVAALRFIIATPALNAQTITLDAGQRLLGLPRDVAFMVDK
jgi:NAD(P)-dependent dehydrogenase (short-subunit alcohol dehydrogenase family)